MSQPSPNTEGINECDTDAGTCCLCRNFTVYKYTRRTADIYTYDKSHTPATNVPIVTGATAYNDPTSGNTFILLFNEALFYGNKMDHSLFNPNQMRKFGIPVWDNPFDHERPSFLLVLLNYFSIMCLTMILFNWRVLNISISLVNMYLDLI